MTLGKKNWAIAEGYIPGKSTGPGPEMVSHETACILNPNSEKAHIEITIYFSDKEPLGPFKIEVEGKRTKHVRFNDLHHPGDIPRDTDYSSIISSDVPIIVQHTRLDSRQNANALLSTVAYSQ